jgi:carboxylesterase type B
MCSDVPLFNRAVLMSGTPATGPPLELKYKEAEYRALLKFCGIDEDDPERLKKLREVPVGKLVAAARGTGIPVPHGFRDEKLWPRGFPTYFTENELIDGCEWVDEIIIGDGFFEVCLHNPTL